MNLFTRIISTDRFFQNIIQERNLLTNNYNQIPFLSNWPEFVLYGYSRPMDNYAAVIYVANRITLHVFGMYDVISFGFNGCLMAAFTYNSTQRYVAHIPPAQMKTWEHFVNQRNVSNVYEFNPMSSLRYQQFVSRNYPAYRIWGIIENGYKAYALEVFENISYTFGNYTTIGASKIVKTANARLLRIK